MKKTGLEIVEMIAKGEAPKRIKINGTIYNFNKELNDYVFDNYGDLEKLYILGWLNEEFEIIEEEPKVWQPELNKDYWCIDYDGRIMNDYFSVVDELKYAIGNCFKTKEEAEKVLEKIKIYMQLKRFAEEHNTEPIDWNNQKQKKWYIFYNYYNEKIRFLPSNGIKDISQVYLTSEELCEQAIEEIGEDNIKKLFEEDHNANS